MGVLTFTARIHDLIHRKSDIEYRLQKITRKMNHLTDYSAVVGNDILSIGELLSVPGAMLGRTLNYLGFAQNYANGYMQQNAPYMQQMYAQQNGGQLDPQMQQYIMEQLYKDGREKAKEIEERNLKRIEEDLQQQKEREQAQLSEVEEELKSAKEARKAAIKDMAPQYTAQ